MERFFLSIAWWVFTLPACQPISRELDSFPNWLMERPFRPLTGAGWSCFIFLVEFHTIQVLIYLPILSFLLLHSSTLSCWWRTCWSGACTFLIIVDAKYLMYDVWLCNTMSIFSVSLNIINTCMKGLHSHVLDWLVFMYLASILERVA